MTRTNRLRVRCLISFSVCAVCHFQLACLPGYQQLTPGHIEELLREIDQLNFAHHLRIEKIEFNRAGQARAKQMISRWSTADGSRSRLEIERFRLDSSSSLPHQISVYSLFPEFSCKIQCDYFPGSQRTKRLAVFVYPDSASMFLPASFPLFAPVAPKIPTLEDLFKRRNSLDIVESTSDSDVIMVKFGVPENGDHRMELDKSDQMAIVEYVREINIVDWLSAEHKLGEQIHERQEPGTVYVYERSRCHSIEYNTVNGKRFPIRAKCDYLAKRQDGRETSFSDSFEINLEPHAGPQNDLIVWENPQLEVPNGTGVAHMPRDNLRYEFHDGKIVKILDSRALESIEGVQFSAEKARWKPLRLYGSLVIGLVAVVALIWFLRSK